MDKVLCYKRPGPVPTKEQLALGHSGRPLSRLPPLEEARLKAQLGRENSWIGSTVEKEVVQKFRELSEKLGLDPHDPNNPFYTRPTVPK
jgi:hypothetical protein